MLRGFGMAGEELEEDVGQAALVVEAGLGAGGLGVGALEWGEAVQLGVWDHGG
jgi:hypothetical protein